MEIFCCIYNFQAYHSSLMDSDTKLVGNMALLPLKTQFKGPAPKESEILAYFCILKLLINALYVLYISSDISLNGLQPVTSHTRQLVRNVPVSFFSFLFQPKTQTSSRRPSTTLKPMFSSRIMKLR